MAQPMFSALGGMTPDEVLRRLGQAGGQPPVQFLNGEEVFQATNAAGRGGTGLLGNIDFGKVLAGAKAPEAANETPGTTGPSAGPQPPLAPPPTQAPTGPGGLGRMMGDAAELMGRGSAGQPPQAQSPFAPLAAPQMPAFSPVAAAEKTPFSPVQVEGAVRTGMFNPAGSNAWDRSVTANSAEEELRLRQDAKYNSVLDMIRPGGIGMPGTTGPIVGLQPWEVQAMANLGGRQAGDLTTGRQIASNEGIQEQERTLRRLTGNQTSQTARDIANLNAQSDTQRANLDAQTRRDVAATEAGSRNNPQMLKAQMAGPLLAAVQGDPFKFAAGMQAFEAATGRPGPDGATRSITDVVAGNPEHRATQSLRSLEPLLGKVGEAGKLQFDPASLKTNIGKVVETFAALPPEAQAAFVRQTQAGAYGPATDFQDAVADYYARNALVAEPPPMQRGGMPSQYASQPEGFAQPLVTLNSMPAATMIGRGMDTAGMVYGSGIPYNQLTFNGRSIPFDPKGVVNPKGLRAELFGAGHEAQKYAPKNAGNAAAMLRELMKLNQQPK